MSVKNVPKLGGTNFNLVGNASELGARHQEKGKVKKGESLPGHFLGSSGVLSKSSSHAQA
jgi:hypothetical protein